MTDKGLQLSWHSQDICKYYEVIQKMTSTTQPVSQMPPYCDCLTPGKEVNGQMDSLWLSRVETACSDISDSLCSSECYTLLSEAGLH